MTKALLEMLAALEFLDLTFRVPVANAQGGAEKPQPPSEDGQSGPPSYHSCDRPLSSGSVQDSVEDLMLNMSIGVEGNEIPISPPHSHCRQKSCSSTDSPYLSNTSINSSNVFLPDPTPNPDPSGTLKSSTSIHSLDNRLGCGLKQLSSTNISHIEHFSLNNNGALYVSGDDVRRRKHNYKLFKKNKMNHQPIYSKICHAKTRNEDNISGSCGSLNRHECGHKKNLSNKRLHSQSSNGSSSTLAPNSEFLAPNSEFLAPNSEFLAPNSELSPVGCARPGYGDGEDGILLSTSQLEQMSLPPDSCFETAFTSDSPKTRIIPQKSVDTLHLRQIKRRRRSNNSSNNGLVRPKSIAVPHCYSDIDELYGANKSLGSTDFLGGISSYCSVGDVPNACSTENFRVPNPPLKGNISNGCSPALSNDFDRSRSTGDLVVNEPFEDHCNQEGSTEVFLAPASTDDNPFFKSSSFVNKVRDSIRRKKAKDKVALKKMSRKSPYNSSIGDEMVSLEEVADNSHPSHSCTISLSSDQHSFASSHENTPNNMHIQNGQTLTRFRTPSGGFANLGLSLSPPQHFDDSDQTKSANHHFSQGVISPIVPSQHNSFTTTVKPATISPFGLSSAGEMVETHSISSSNVDSYSGYTSATSNPLPDHRSIPSNSKAFRVLGCKPPSVTSTLYSTNYATNYNSLPRPYKKPHHSSPPGCLSHSINSQLQASDEGKFSPSKSASISSLYTTALTCYDESDPQSFAVKEIGCADSSDVSMTYVFKPGNESNNTSGKGGQMSWKSNNYFAARSS